MQRPQDSAPKQQPWQDAKRGQSREYRISGREREQAREKRSATAEHYGTGANPVEKITLVVAHFLVEMASGKNQTKEKTDHDTACVAGFSVFSRRDGIIRHFYSGEMSASMADPEQDPRGGSDVDPLWLMLDWTPEGRGTGWYPQLDY